MRAGSGASRYVGVRMQHKYVLLELVVSAHVHHVHLRKQYLVDIVITGGLLYCLPKETFKNPDGDNSVHFRYMRFSEQREKDPTRTDSYFDAGGIAFAAFGT